MLLSPMDWKSCEFQSRAYKAHRPEGFCETCRDYRDILPFFLRHPFTNSINGQCLAHEGGVQLCEYVHIQGKHMKGHLAG